MSLHVWSNPFPIKIVNGLLVSEAVIEGKKVVVIFDTGAPGVVLNNRFYSSDESESVECAGINGSFECRMHEIRDWTWMGIKHKQTSALVLDLSFLEKELNREVYALIGLSILDDYYVSIDYDQESISLSEKMNVDKNEMIKFRYVNHLPVITCRVNGEKKVLGLDTGSEINYLFSPDKNDTDKFMTEAFPVLVTGTDSHEDIKYRVNMNLRLNEDENYPSEFIVDLDDPASYQSKSFDGFLGQPFMSRFNVIIHPSKKILILSPRKHNENLPVTLMATNN